MRVFYHYLRSGGWINPTAAPSEWVSGDGQFEIDISHSGMACTIRYRRRPEWHRGEAASEYYRRRQQAGWNQLSRPHGQSGNEFVSWLARSYSTISDWCTMMAVTARAPGE